MQFDGIYQQLSAEESAGNAEITSEPAFMELQVALQGKAGSQMGDAVIAAQPPDFKSALKICTELLVQSKHTALLVALTKASTGVHGFQGLADAMELLQKIFSERWTGIHPEEDKDDPDDPWWERINLLRELTDNPKTVEHLYELKLVEVRHIGVYSKRDVDIANGRRDASDEEKERCNANLIRGAFSECNEEELRKTDSSLKQAIEGCDALDKVLSTEIGSDAPSFELIKKQLTECHQVLHEYAAGKLTDPEPQAEVADESVVPAESSAADSSGQSAQTLQVVVNSTAFADRDSVAAAFDDVMRFYQEFEPSSPVPILLFKARQMVYKNFFDILRELAPQHQDNFRELMSTLKDDPLGFLLEHSYNSFLSGEKFEIGAAAAAEPVAPSSDWGVADGSETQRDNAEQSVTATDAVSAAAEATPGAAITSRNQVLQTLNDIQKFFEVHEPSSPIPLIVQKVRNLVPKNFLDLLTEFEPAAGQSEAAAPAAASDGTSSEWT